MTSPKVSIVIPAYNEGNNILACVNSLKVQNFLKDDYEIIVVDNNSTDNTHEVVKSLDIVYGIEYRKGPAAAKNKGIESAKGDIIVFIDADCIAHPDWLQNMMVAFRNNEIGCVAGEIIAYEPKTKIEHFLVEKKHLSQFINVNHPFLSYAATADAAYRKEVFERVGLFDESLFTGEDADMSWRMQLNTKYKLSYSPEAVVYHPHEATLKALFKQKERHAYGSVALYKKYRRFWPEQNKSLKKIYWEYRSLAKRLLKFAKDYLSNDVKNLDKSHFQIILEAAWKLGLIKGSLRHKVWYV